MTTHCNNATLCPAGFATNFKLLNWENTVSTAIFKWKKAFSTQPNFSQNDAKTLRAKARYNCSAKKDIW